MAKVKKRPTRRSLRVPVPITEFPPEQIGTMPGLSPRQRFDLLRPGEDFNPDPRFSSEADLGAFDRRLPLIQPGPESPTGADILGAPPEEDIRALQQVNRLNIMSQPEIAPLGHPLREGLDQTSAEVDRRIQQLRLQGRGGIQPAGAQGVASADPFGTIGVADAMQARQAAADVPTLEAGFGGRPIVGDALERLRRSQQSAGVGLPEFVVDPNPGPFAADPINTPTIDPLTGQFTEGARRAVNERRRLDAGENVHRLASLRKRFRRGDIGEEAFLEGYRQFAEEGTGPPASTLALGRQQAEQRANLTRLREDPRLAQQRLQEGGQTAGGGDVVQQARRLAAIGRLPFGEALQQAREMQTADQAREAAAATSALEGRRVGIEEQALATQSDPDRFFIEQTAGSTDPFVISQRDKALRRLLAARQQSDGLPGQQGDASLRETREQITDLESDPLGVVQATLGLEPNASLSDVNDRLDEIVQESLSVGELQEIAAYIRLRMAGDSEFTKGVEAGLGHASRAGRFLAFVDRGDSVEVIRDSFKRARVMETAQPHPFRARPSF